MSSEAAVYLCQTMTDIVAEVLAERLTSCTGTTSRLEKKGFTWKWNCSVDINRRNSSARLYESLRSGYHHTHFRAAPEIKSTALLGLE